MYPTSCDTSIFYIVFRGFIYMLDFSWEHSVISRDTALDFYELVELIQAQGIPFPQALSPDKTGRLLSDNQITKHSDGVFTVPWLSPDYCDWLSTFFPAVAYEPNKEEPYAAQIPEIVLLEHNKSLHLSLETLYDMTLRPLVHLLMGQDIERFNSIQLARYEPSRVRQGTFHTDHDSDITVTIALNDDYHGGGLQLFTDNGITGAEPVTVSKLPKGTATLFKGRQLMHKGLAVESGVKHLLVFWMST